MRNQTRLVSRFAVLLLVGLLLAWLLSTRSPTAAQVNAEADVLLAVLKDTRASGLSKSRSGTGIAEADGIEEAIKRGTELAERTTRVTFSFRDEDSVCKESLPGDAEKPFRAVLIKGSKVFTYIDHKSRQKGITIENTLDNQGLLFSPRSWSLKEFAKVPLWPDDQTFFNFVLTQRPVGLKVDVSREKTIIRLTMDALQLAGTPPERSVERLVMEFDMSRAGMLQSYLYESADKAGGNTTQEKLETKWQEVDGAVVPVERKASATYVRAGKKTQFGTSIKFTEFRISDVPKEQHCLAAMGIPDGTPIIDHATGMRWRYFKGLDETVIIEGLKGSGKTGR